MEINAEAIRKAINLKAHPLGPAEVEVKPRPDGTKVWAVHFNDAPQHLTPEEVQRELAALKHHLATHLDEGPGRTAAEIATGHTPPQLLVWLRPRFDPSL